MRPSASASSTSPSVSTVIDQGMRMPGLVHRRAELLAVLGAADRGGVGADQLDPEPLQGAVLVQAHRQVQRGLAAERRQQRVGALLFDDLGHRPGQQRLDVGGGGELGVGHDRRRVRVDEDDFVALLEQHLAGLDAGVVELGRLADHDRPGADQEDLLDVVSTRHRQARQEPLEQVAGVVRAGAGLGVVLDGGAGDVAQDQALDRAVVEVELGELGDAEVGLPADRLVALDPRLAARAGDGEAVVLGGDVDPARLQVLDRVVGAAVAEGQLVGLEADRAAEQLVAEADAEDRASCRRCSRTRVDDVVERGRVAGAVGEEDDVGVLGEDLLGGAGAGQQGQLGAVLAQLADDARS